MTAVDSALAHAELAPDQTRSRTVVWQDPLASLSQGAGLSGIEYMQAILSGDIPPPPIAVLLNMAPVELAEGLAIFEGQPGEEHFNPIGVVHGGYAATLLDSAMGCAVQTTLPAGHAYTTLTLEVKYTRALTLDTGPVRAEGKVVHRGRRQATVEAELVAAGTGKLIAHATSTCMILEL